MNVLIVVYISHFCICWSRKRKCWTKGVCICFKRKHNINRMVYKRLVFVSNKSTSNRSAYQNCINNDTTREILIFKYCSNKNRMNEIICNPRIIVSGTQTSTCLWANNSSFIVPMGLDQPLLLAKIRKNSIKSEFIFTHCKNVRFLPILRNFSTKYSGCFFTGKQYGALIFWITNCIENVIISLFYSS